MATLSKDIVTSDGTTVRIHFPASLLTGPSPTSFQITSSSSRPSRAPPAVTSDTAQSLLMATRFDDLRDGLGFFPSTRLDEFARMHDLFMDPFFIFDPEDRRIFLLVTRHICNTLQFYEWSRLLGSSANNDLLNMICYLRAWSAILRKPPPQRMADLLILQTELPSATKMSLSAGTVCIDAVNQYITDLTTRQLQDIEEEGKEKELKEEKKSKKKATSVTKKKAN